MRIRWLLAAVAAALLVLAVGQAVLAQGEVPPPYAGLKNPFAWSDAAAQASGKQVYQQSCLGCHGVTGNGVASADFSARDYPQRLESRPDFYFWIVSEGRMGGGMPAYKATLTEQQRWQVLTYIWSLGKAGPVTPTPTPPPEAGLLQVNAVSRVEAGQPLRMSAIVLDRLGKPIAGARVQFFTRERFVTTALMLIGDAITDAQGVAVFQYFPRRAEATEIVVRYGASEASTRSLVTEADQPFYHTEVGIRLPSWAEGVPRAALGHRAARGSCPHQRPVPAGRAVFVAVALRGGTRADLGDLLQRDVPSAPHSDPRETGHAELEARATAWPHRRLGAGYSYGAHGNHRSLQPFSPGTLVSGRGHGTARRSRNTPKTDLCPATGRVTAAHLMVK